LQGTPWIISVLALLLMLLLLLLLLLLADDERALPDRAWSKMGVVLPLSEPGGLPPSLMLAPPASFLAISMSESTASSRSW
jgi:hypothetical protein